MASTDLLWCIVPAAGSGRRFGSGIPKQYLPLAGKPMLECTLDRLAACREIAGLMVVLADGDAYWPGIDAMRGKPVRTATGAPERSGSVLAGLRALPAEVGADDFVLVHDAARPCIAADDVAMLVARGAAAGGALLAAPVRDTLKRAGNERRVIATEPREMLWRAMTPQMFRRGELTRALEAAENDGIAVTDEAMAMESAGHRPMLIEGAEDNIKVTTAADLALAAYLLRQAP
ncbi:MAG TPA: 2-C-methyl-D-erythritol 4-phosphate cytidylyltransferase [Rhodanobacteraceae bacterium]|jgi:2-C-methyl-D-erythritol 4-phosphate cytidylyltransferase|nr:2-C-methyl-D-erythritol 4-phosphate cytidylyltransferase [Rhodanobacteraceae bacterium]